MSEIWSPGLAQTFGSNRYRSYSRFVAKIQEKEFGKIQDIQEITGVHAKTGSHKLSLYTAEI